MQKLTEFATAVGGDIKQLNQLIQTLQTTVTQLQGREAGVSMSQVEDKIGELRTALFGGELDEAYDTFKEIADKLKSLDGSIGAAITEKLTELGEEITALKAVYNTDLVSTYNQAKA